MTLLSSSIAESLLKTLTCQH
ncbi:hypothetical protein JMJ77_0012840 [Colletotrichum scovillei]|uniref:Uncharacterized protein n=1 Tax=Colletotrichum scovillei TaxID=1209932 RepID=A0A9P7R4J2_9PEZI|nr:hypothetical protein JMJ77_0012840 [Colletotrichum scovillei]KAG7069123.1 hypothetical protein JMJ76_0002799 [Colletotrichum scovillei]KAG7073075.1 hypothetical protein JMJ78_0014056 [Colletotrichum scovillei]